jgi:antitoxin MazE
MKVQVQKWGNSLALRIPKSFALEAKVKEGSAVDISLKKGKIVLTPLNEKKYTLEGLLSKVNDQNIHEETFTGKPVGREVW